jgi:hypothetical protein
MEQRRVAASHIAMLVVMRDDCHARNISGERITHTPHQPANISGQRRPASVALAQIGHFEEVESFSPGLPCPCTTAPLFLREDYPPRTTGAFFRDLAELPLKSTPIENRSKGMTSAHNSN